MTPRIDSWKVSAVIPAFNCAETIETALASVMAQDYPVDEIIVVDDASTDGTADRVVNYPKPVHLIRHPVNRGPAATRNTGVASATGELIALLDADDTWAPHKLHRQVPSMRERDLAVSCTGTSVVDPCGKALRENVRHFAGNLGLGVFVWGCHISPGSTMIARRWALERLGGYDAQLRRYEDWDVLLRASLAGLEIGYLREPLSTVTRSEAPPPHVVQHSLDLMRTKHLGAIRLRGRRPARQFKAALSFEKAVSEGKAGRWGSAASALTRSLLLSPKGHLPLHLVLVPWLTSKARRPTSSTSASTVDAVADEIGDRG